MRTERHLPVLLFLGAEGIILVWFLALDLLGRPSEAVKYGGVCLCLAAALTGIPKGARLLPAAMALTVFADTFLILRDDHYLLGVLAFCAVQTLYAWWLTRRSPWGWLPARAGLLLAGLAGLGALGALDVLTAASVFSFSQLSVSAVQSAVLARRGGISWLLPAALGLFWCCDACVGLRNVLAYLPGFPLYQLVERAGLCIWIFYLPSQVLLVLWGREGGAT